MGEHEGKMPSLNNDQQIRLGAVAYGAVTDGPQTLHPDMVLL